MRSKVWVISSIVLAFKDGYKQSEIAKFLNLSVSSVSKIIKIQYSTPDPLKLKMQKILL